MENTNNPAAPGTPIRATTRLREWLGWFGVMAWMYSMINGYMYLSNVHNDNDYYWFLLAFLIVFAASVAAISFRYGSTPGSIGGIAFYATPVAIIITAVFSFIPNPCSSALFAVSPAFIAPALARRAYGIVRSARSVLILTTYMSGVAAGFLFMQLSYYLNDWGASTELLYLIYAIPPLLAWLGSRRSIDSTSNAQRSERPRLSKTLLIVITATILLMFWLISVSDLISLATQQFNAVLYFPVYVVLPTVFYVLLAFIYDKGHERTGVIIGLGLLLTSLQLAFLAGDSQNKMVVPLLFSNRFFEIYIELFVLTIPISFFSHVKRPVFAASLGVELYLLAWIFGRVVRPSLPSALKSGVPLLVVTGLSAIAFFILLHFLFERHRERTLAAALYTMLHRGSGVQTLTETETTATSEEQKMTDSGFTQDEIKVAILLIEGDTQGNITKKLHSTAADTKQKIDTIRKKISGMDDQDPVITAIVKKYKLTRRETEMLRSIRDGVTNVQIAVRLTISEETVKAHMRGLKNKLSVGGKQEIAGWLEDFEKTQV